jgi:hypothetical protein
MAGTTCHNPSGIPWACLPNEPLSHTIPPYAGIILTGVSPANLVPSSRPHTLTHSRCQILILLGLFRQYGLEEGLMKRWRFKAACATLPPRAQRSLATHCMSLFVKLLLFVIGKQPLSPHYHTSLSHPANPFSIPSSSSNRQPTQATGNPLTPHSSQASTPSP